MNIECAKKLKVGDVVYFPADRGDAGGNGKVTYISPNQEECEAYGTKEKYIWVSVQRHPGCVAVWPSNRLG